jgi:hypothetical protein
VGATQALELPRARFADPLPNPPPRPPAPPESRTSRAKSADATARGQAADGPTPIIYRVTWPATQPELGLDTRVELDWPGRASTAPVSLRWNEPTPD